jgi:acetyl-CoA carboxylase biotin carboxylase subunit
VKNPDEFASQFAAARIEALAAFGDGGLYLEKMIVNPRHIEIQILGDTYGNIIHLGERDCTIQRRRQKLIEEAPSPFLTPRLRKKIGKAAVKVAYAAGYTSAGTVEFLVDQDHNFYFMEVNTRIQVEHTVTEEYTGIDIVKEQLRIALGEKLPVKQRKVPFAGHVMEFRINAEDPKRNFLPHAGRIEYYLPPGGPHVRVDSACYSGYAIPPYYDPMIAKLIVKGKDRTEVLQNAKRALKEFHIGGIATTLPFHQQMVEDPRFIAGEYDIHYVDEGGMNPR